MRRKREIQQGKREHEPAASLRRITGADEASGLAIRMGRLLPIQYLC